MEEKQSLSCPVSSKEEVIEVGKFEEILSLGLCLNSYFLLTLIEGGFEIPLLPRWLAWRQTLSRKGYITDEGVVTLSGKELLKAIREDCHSYKALKKASKAITATEFDIWWREFPGTDTFEFKGQKFIGARALRTKKDECRVKFNKILNEGEYKGEDMLRALKFEILQKKSLSVVTKQNKMSYLQNSSTYLHQRSFEPFIELSKDKEAIEAVNNSTPSQFTSKNVDI